MKFKEFIEICYTYGFVGKPKNNNSPDLYLYLTLDEYETYIIYCQDGMIDFSSGFIIYLKYIGESELIRMFEGKITTIDEFKTLMKMLQINPI
jgi:hypothetical protein